MLECGDDGRDAWMRCVDVLGNMGYDIKGLEVVEEVVEEVGEEGDGEDGKKEEGEGGEEEKKE